MGNWLVFYTVRLHSMVSESLFLSVLINIIWHISKRFHSVSVSSCPVVFSLNRIKFIHHVKIEMCCMCQNSLISCISHTISPIKCSPFPNIIPSIIVNPDIRKLSFVKYLILLNQPIFPRCKTDVVFHSYFLQFLSEISLQ